MLISFKQEAAQVGLLMLPYRGGFLLQFLQTLRMSICRRIEKRAHLCDCISNGIRIAACGIPKCQMTGLAEKIYNAMKSLGKL